MKDLVNIEKFIMNENEIKSMKDHCDQTIKYSSLNWSMETVFNREWIAAREYYQYINDSDNGMKTEGYR